MTTYHTETGSYVLVDSDGRVIAKTANHSPGEHQVNDAVDAAASFDVDSAAKLSEYERDSIYMP